MKSKSESKVHEIGKRCVELHAKGKTFPQMVPIINLEYPERTWKASTLSKYASAYRKAPPRGQAGVSAPLPDEQEEPSEHTEPSLPSAWEARMRSIAREVVEEAIQNMRNIPPAMDETTDMPPEPQTIKGMGKGRREDRAYVKVSVTMDKNLWKLFEAERKKLKVSTGRMMDILLWRAFNRPKLSFEPAE